MNAASRFTKRIVLLAALGLAGAWAVAQEPRPQADDQCVAQCDVASDQCMAEAGGNAAKERACDTAYDECLRKCG